MKKLIFGLTVSIFVASIQASEPSLTTEAPTIIKSKNQPFKYLQSNKKDTPLNYLSPDSKEIILDNLTFEKKGLASYYFEDIKTKLTSEQVNELLFLFGKKEEPLNSSASKKPQNTTSSYADDNATKKFSQLFDNLFRTDQKYSVDKSRGREQQFTHFLKLTKEAISNLEINSGDNSLKSLVEKELIYLMRSIKYTLFFGEDGSLNDLISSAFFEFERRKIVNQAVVTLFHEHNVKTRQFEIANQLKEKYQLTHKNSLPLYDKNYTDHQQRYLKLNERKLSIGSHSVPNRSFMIVVGNPTCQFALTAIDAISKDKKLNALLATKSFWLSPPSGSFDYQRYLRERNNTRPIKFNEAFSLADWPQIKNWDSPTFYIFDKRGHVKTLSGWPEKNQIDVLKNMLSKAGILEERS